MATQLLIMGASVRAAAQAAVRAGLQVVGSDLFGDEDLVSVGPHWKIKRYPGEFLRVISNLQGLPWMYTGGLENYPTLVDRFAAHGKLWGNNGNTLRQVRDPQTLAQVVHAVATRLEAPLRFPQTLATSLLPVAPQGDGAWLYKPRRGSGGLAVRPANQMAKYPRQGFWQRKITGIPHSASFLSAGGSCLVLGISRQYCVQDLAGQSNAAQQTPFAYAGSIGPLPMTEEEADWLIELGEQLTRQAGLIGLWGADFIVDDDGVWWLLEVNPRYTASMEVLEESLSVPLLYWHQMAAENAWLPEVPKHALLAPQRRTIAKGIVYASRSFTANELFLNRVKSLSKGQQPAGIVYEWPTLADIPNVGQFIPGGAPVCSIYAREHTAETADLKLRALLGRVQAYCDEQGTDIATQA